MVRPGLEPAGVMGPTRLTMAPSPLVLPRSKDMPAMGLDAGSQAVASGAKGHSKGTWCSWLPSNAAPWLVSLLVFSGDLKSRDFHLTH